MQALTSNPTFRGAQDVSAVGDLSQALGGQLGIADASAKKIQNQMATNVLGTARGQASDAQSGMAQASRLATSDALNRAKANQQVRGARNDAIAQVAGASTRAYAKKTSNQKLTDFMDTLEGKRTA
jgi:hypothetical protein